mgnify:CR=1 FL=1
MIDSQPHQAALSAARTATGSEVSAAQLTTSDTAQNDYIPPVYVTDGSDAQTDRFVYYYMVTPDSLWTSASGWSWRPAAAVDLPQPVRAVMMTASAV